jgi:Flp pilus assembly protein TadG
MSRARYRRCSLDREEGAVAIMTAMLIVALFAATAFAIDLSLLRHDRAVVQRAVDMGALAGADYLPVKDSAEANTARNAALMVAHANAPRVPMSYFDVTFRCVVNDPENNGGNDSPDLGVACGPAVRGSWSSGWNTKQKYTSHDCNPYAGDLCNTIYLRGSDVVAYNFAPVIGFKQGSTGVVQAASCTGSCSQTTGPLDVVMVLDRTASMTQGDIDNLKNGARSVLDIYDASDQWVGLVSLPYGQASNKCVVNDPQLYPAGNSQLWSVVPIQGGYDNPDGTLNQNSPIGKAINCMQRAGSPTVRVNGVDRTSAGHTNLGDPLDAARAMLASQGRPDVPDVIIFETDGQANQPYGMQPCSYLNTKATAAKAAGQTVFTIAYGLDSPPVKCTDTSGIFYNKYATTNLAMAATSSNDDLPGGCASTENSDGDSYFCTPGSSDLEPVFRRVAVAALKHSRLINI